MSTEGVYSRDMGRGNSREGAAPVAACSCCLDAAQSGANGRWGLVLASARGLFEVSRCKTD